MAQAFASVEEEMQGSESHPNEAVPFQQQFSNIPAPTSQGEACPPGTMSNVYPTGTAPSIYPPGNVPPGIYPPGGAPMHSSMMVGHGREFNPPRAGFQMEDHGSVYQPEQGTWQGGAGNEPVHPSVGLIPPSSTMVPQGDMRPEFHPNLESGASQDPPEGNLLA